MRGGSRAEARGATSIGPGPGEAAPGRAVVPHNARGEAYRVKLYKVVSREAHEEVERLRAAWDAIDRGRD